MHFISVPKKNQKSFFSSFISFCTFSFYLILFHSILFYLPVYLLINSITLLTKPIKLYFLICNSNYQKLLARVDTVVSGQEHLYLPGYIEDEEGNGDMQAALPKQQNILKSTADRKMQTIFRQTSP